MLEATAMAYEGEEPRASPRVLGHIRRMRLGRSSSLQTLNDPSSSVLRSLKEEVLCSNKRMARQTSGKERSPAYVASHLFSSKEASLSDYAHHLDNFDRVQSILSKKLRRQEVLRLSRLRHLRRTYKRLNRAWRQHCERMDISLVQCESSECLQGRQTLSGHLHPSGLLPKANETAAIPGQSGGTTGSSSNGGTMNFTTSNHHCVSLDESNVGTSFTRTNRRNTQSSGLVGFGDAVRSEAEFLEILASLGNADMQDPNLRAARTTATEPDMNLCVNRGLTASAGSSKQGLLQNFDDDNGYVADPLSFYLSDFDPDVWTEEERAIFARRYSLFPKQFGKIAASLPQKTASQCVSYYYVTKKSHDYKSLLASRNRDRRRKARLVKPKKGRGSALMADLKAATATAKEEVVEEEEASPPGVESLVPTLPNSRKIARSNVRAERRVASTSQSVDAIGEDRVPDPPSPQNNVAEVASNDESSKHRLASRQSTSSYWSIAERAEFLRSLAIVGRDWDALARNLSTKSAAQARNFFVRNAEDTDFVEAVQLAKSSTDVSEADRREAADALVRRRNAMPTQLIEDADAGPAHLRGRLNISALLNSEAEQDSLTRRASLQEWFGDSKIEIQNDATYHHEITPVSNAHYANNRTGSDALLNKAQSSTYAPGQGACPSRAVPHTADYFSPGASSYSGTRYMHDYGDARPQMPFLVASPHTHPPPERLPASQYLFGRMNRSQHHQRQSQGHPSQTDSYQH